jgi:hypothetical protein
MSEAADAMAGTANGAASIVIASAAVAIVLRKFLNI